ncbi:MAG: hypothetical protein NC418_02300 [Muribaculaceae bacterium]|nr:hypothetical protein [Muribaculaceae bacterium]
MSSHTAHNAQVFKVGLKNFTETQVKPKIVAMLKNVAQRLVDYVDGSFIPMPPYRPGGNGGFPAWTGTMHDATGVGVYVDGALSSYLPTKKAIAENDGVDGRASLTQALNAATSQFSKGIWIVLFSATPYAYKINTQGSKWGRGVGFFKTFEDYLLNDVIANLKPITA